MMTRWRVGIIFSLAIGILVFENCADFKAASVLSQSSEVGGNHVEQPGPSPTPMPMPPVIIAENDAICSGNPNPNFPKFPNEPANKIRLVDWGFDTIEGGGLVDAYPDPKKEGHFITSCSDAPVSPTSVLKNIRRAAGDGSGGIQIDYFQKKLDEIYVGLVWKANPDFEGAYGNRLFIILNDHIQGFVSWNKLEGKTMNEGRIGFSPVAGPNVNNCHLVSDPRCVAGSMNLEANIKPNHSVGLNQWHLVEVIMKRSSAPGQKDGRIRWWVDGELLGDYSGLDSGGSQISAVSYQQGWVNRQLVNAPPQKGDWYYLADHLRISEPK